MKVLILMVYFNRPILARNALKSVLRANEYHKDLELMILDDNSPIPIKPIVKDVMKGHLHKVSVSNSKMSFDEKIHRGLIIGEYANFGIRQSDADIGITLCDDDEIYPTYLQDITQYFQKNPEVMYAYSHVSLFNPLIKSERVPNLTSPYNKQGAINPVDVLDGSQVAFRLSCCKEHGAWFQQTTLCVEGMPWVKDTDKSFFEQLYERFGMAQPTGLISQYKAIHDWQLVWHKKTDAVGLKAHYDNLVKHGGTLF